MKLTVFTLVVFLALPTFAEASFIRFWAGFKRTDVTNQKFLGGLNESFFRETIQLSSGKGLLSYQPYFSKSTRFLPHEFALVVYSNEADYRAIRSTPEGERYSARHWDYFDQASSKSTVAQPFEGRLTTGSAYQLNPEFKSWQSTSTTFAVYRISSANDLGEIAAAFGKLKRDPNVVDSVLLVTNGWIAEYRSLKKASAFIPLPLPLIEVSSFPSKTLADAQAIGAGQGINFRFR
jgi:hypothetical protein